jgi:hypothetical protein
VRAARPTADAAGSRLNAQLLERDGRYTSTELQLADDASQRGDEMEEKGER